MKNKYFKYGAIMGGIFCLYTTIMWLTKLDTTFLKYGRYIDSLIIILPISIIFKAIWKENKFYRVSIIKRFKIAILIGGVSYLIYHPFLYIYHTHINPEWFNSVINLKEVELKAENMTHDQINITLQKMKSLNVVQSQLLNLQSLISSVIIIPILIALLSLIFVRHKQDNHNS